MVFSAGHPEGQKQPERHFKQRFGQDVSSREQGLEKRKKEKQTKLEIFQLFVLMMLSASAAESTEEES